MLYDSAVAEHYHHGSLLDSITSSIVKMGKTPDAVTLEDLAPVDDFHIGGRAATANFIDQLKFLPGDHVIDIGCGLGGASRYTAHKYNCRITGIDLTEEYIRTGNAISEWLKLGGHITLHHGSALALPFDNNTFTGAYMMHVGMNIEDKHQLFNEVQRVLTTGSTFGIYDVMKTGSGELLFPVPWASEQNTSRLASPEEYTGLLEKSGFRITAVTNRSEFALKFFQELKKKNEAAGGPPPLGLHILMKESAQVKIQNMISNIMAGIISPVEIIVTRI